MNALRIIVDRVWRMCLDRGSWVVVEFCDIYSGDGHWASLSRSGSLIFGGWQPAIVPWSCSVTSDDCDCAWIKICNDCDYTSICLQPWQLCFDRVLWYLVIVIVIVPGSRYPMVAIVSQSVFNRDWVPGYPVMVMFPGSRMGIVPRSSSVISDDCDWAKIKFHIMPWLVSRSSMEIQLSSDRGIWWVRCRLWLDEVSWYAMIVPGSSMGIVPGSGLLNRDWVPWYAGDGNCALIELRGIRWLRLAYIAFHITSWLPLDWVWGMCRDSEILELWLSFLVSGGCQLRLDQVSWYPMIVIVVEPRSSFILCYDYPWIEHRECA